MIGYQTKTRGSTLDYSVAQRCGVCHEKTRRINIAFGTTNPIRRTLGWFCRRCETIYVNPDFDFKKIIIKNLTLGYDAKEKKVYLKEVETE